MLMSHARAIVCCLIVFLSGASRTSAESTIDRCVIPNPNALSAPARGEEGVLEGAVSWVADGDSIWVMVEGREIEVRLADLDAPERDQPHGWEAKLALIDLLRSRRVRLRPRDVDRHGRIVARVWVEQLDVSRELLRRGFAWFYPAFAEDASLRCEELHAKAANLGLWGQSAPQAPWQWRRERPPSERFRP